MRGRPFQLLGGVLILGAGIGMVIAGLTGAASWTVALVGGVVLAIPSGLLLLVFLAVGLNARRAMQAAQLLVRLAAEIGEEQDTPDIRDQADSALRTIRANLTRGSQEKVRACLLPAVDARGPLREVCAHAAALTGGPDSGLDEALKDLKGFSRIENVRAVAYWLRDWASDPLERLARFADAVPPEARLGAVEYLIHLYGSPKAEKAEALRPYAEDIYKLAADKPNDLYLPDWCRLLSGE